ncbi:hypothetical protein A3A36_01595 [Candidatus Kaiserbacteria bacterium RIFCSPLOWO2_01_FULL_52_12b]|uniref:Uncharacterized protein n=1 Tax=Candidatus Kaiserbacteria bacterium RIFCSPLOWO2_01_FULL_52_12b TaxID=1798509 RepID=A0A1F6EY20_9BACT|nr:MAG: hypothetical protein A3A36_01595 [Candidatus Kaiserbacteria bacterium RIFCSPLOWO2_01_FULL_52_12b]
MTLNGTSLIRSVTGVIWLVIAMTLLAELSAPFKTFLAQLAGHHWVGKSILAVIAFGVLYFFFRKSDESKGIWGGVLLVLGSVVVGGLIIVSFFYWHFING